MNYTTDSLRDLYEKANQLATFTKGREPSSLVLSSDGTFEATWTRYTRCGDVEEDSLTITAEDINNFKNETTQS
jgi:hypothetical protein